VFKPEHIDQFKTQYPDTFVIAHPEAPFDVCQKSDFVGSTEYIIKTIAEAEHNTRWLVATELNLVNRLHQQFSHQGKSVHFMAPTISMCSTMFRTDPPALLRILESLVEGEVVNRIQVPEKEAVQARAALQRMFDISV